MEIDHHRRILMNNSAIYNRGEKSTGTSALQENKKVRFCWRDQQVTDGSKENQHQEEEIEHWGE